MTMNRFDSKKQPLNKDEIQKRINLIFNNAIDIYDLMPFGMTVEVCIPTKQDIIVPNQTPEVRSLYITKPVQFVRIQPE